MVPTLTSDISTALTALERLATSTSTSSAGPLNDLLDQHFSIARERLLAGSPPRQVLEELQRAVARSKKDVEKGLKAWYSALNKIGGAVEKAFPPQLGAVSEAYDAEPRLFSGDGATEALDRLVMESFGRRGLWEAVGAMEEETGMEYDDEKRRLAVQLRGIVGDIERGDVSSAIESVHMVSSHPLRFILYDLSFLPYPPSETEGVLTV